MSAKPRSLLWLAIVVAWMVAFAWGYLCHRDRLFPHRWLNRLAFLQDSEEPAGVGESTPVSASPPPPGKWTRARSAPGSHPSSEELSRLAALGYLQGYRPAEERPKIAVHEPSAAYQGLNLYVSGHAPEAILMDMSGQLLHRWHYDLQEVWPDLYPNDQVHKLEYWRRAHLFENGDLLAIFEGLGLIKLDRQSRLLWAYRGGAHHDLFVSPQGDIWLLDREGKLIPRIHPEMGLLEDLVTVLDSDGRLERKISVLEAFERSAYRPLILGSPVREADFLHTNSLERLDGSAAHRHPAFKEGNLLISVLQLSTVAVLNPREEKIVWALTGLWRKQHEPSLLASGRLLLFDNLGAGDRSRVLELDPLTQQVLWRYAGNDGENLFSRGLGACQRLPNGNTLIIESENGRAVEVTAEKRVVWEFYSPHRAGAQGELVAALFDVVRLPPDFGFRGSGPNAPPGD